MEIATRQIGKTALRVTELGLGTAPLGGLFDEVGSDDARAAFDVSWACGVRFVDTAPFYGFGLAERRVGDALRRERRDHFVISTKVGRLLVPDRGVSGAAMNWYAHLPFRPVFDYSYDGIMRSHEHSLQRLGLDRVDILLIHDIDVGTHGQEAHERHIADLRAGGLRALDDLRSSGTVAAIGFGLNEPDLMVTMIDEAAWDVFLLAGRYTLLEQQPLDDLLPACVRRQISVIVGGPYNSGLLVGGDTWNYARAPAQLVARRDRLAMICKAHGVDLAAAALQFPLAHPAVASVIPGARTGQEASANCHHLAALIPSALWLDLIDAGLVRADAPLPASN